MVKIVRHLDEMWRRLNKPELGIMNILSQRLGDMEDRRPGNFPEFDPKAPLLVFSDYAGSHSAAKSETYSFLLVQPDVLPQWEAYRTFIRREYRFTKGRMEYKKLSNTECERACLPWLIAADDLKGLLVTFAVQRSLGSLFDQNKLPALKAERPDLERSSRKTIERMFRVCHCLALILSGLSSAAQEVIWITDEDDIAANEALQASLAQSMRNVSEKYLGEPLANLHCATTGVDNGSMQIEDLASIPDLMAGAISEVQTQHEKTANLPTGHELVPLPETLPEKTRRILEWSSRPEESLKRITLGVYSVAAPKLIHLNRLIFQAEPSPGLKRS